MKTKLLIFIVLALILFLTGCATVKQTPMKDLYPRMYSEKPVSILILPPMNKSTAAEAKEYFSCSLAEPIAQKGYYPLPVEAVYSILKQEGLYDTEVMTPEILQNLKKYFGADAVLMTTIEDWSKTYGELNIKAKYELLDTQTADSLWDFHSNISVNLSSNNSSSGIGGLLADMIVTAVKTAMEDYFPNAYKGNAMTFDKYFPWGKYAPLAGKDGDTMIPSNKRGILVISK